MPRYRYIATDISGKEYRGEQEEPDRTQLYDRLRQRNLFLTDATELFQTNHRKRIKTPELSDFCRQIGTMLASGISLVRAMDIFLKRDSGMKEQQKKIYESLYKSLVRGVALSDAMVQEEGAFPELLINMIRAGEASGRMDETMIKMAKHYEKEHRLNAKVKSATVYPKVLIALTGVVMVLMFTLILPKFFKLFKGMDLPITTRILIGLSNIFLHQWYVLIIVAIIIFAVIYLLKRSRKVRIWIDKKKITMPLVGRPLRIIYTARFSRTLSTLYTSGLSIIECLSICKGTIGNQYISNQFPEVIRMVRNGETLSKAISQVNGFDNKLVSTIMIGEEAGRLDDMLDSTSDVYDYEADMSIQRLISMIEPALIIVMAALIGVVVISVIMPIYQMYNDISAR